jgi:antitoxin (DNA-binding transcriptional repressor) of toxin-antitoxin stability system
MSAAKFKERCLQVIDRVSASGKSVVITKGGRALVLLEPVQEPAASIAGALKSQKKIRRLRGKLPWRGKLSAMRKDK